METSKDMQQDALQDTCHLFTLGLVNDPNDESFWTRIFFFFFLNKAFTVLYDITIWSHGTNK